MPSVLAEFQIHLPSTLIVLDGVSTHFPALTSAHHSTCSQIYSDTSCYAGCQLCWNHNPTWMPGVLTLRSKKYVLPLFATLAMQSKTYVCIQSPLISSPQEAEYALEVADAKRETCYAEKLLAECRMREAILQTRLYRIQLERAQERLNEANRDVGRVRYAVRKSGHFAVLKRTNDYVHTHVHKYKGTPILSFLGNNCGGTEHIFTSAENYYVKIDGNTLAVKLD